MRVRDGFISFHSYKEASAPTPHHARARASPPHMDRSELLDALMQSAVFTMRESILPILAHPPDEPHRCTGPSVLSANLIKLMRGGWLFDDVIMKYLTLVAASRPGVQILVLDNNFLELARKYGPSGVMKRKNMKFSEKDFILLPINTSGVHWTLAVVDNVRRVIKHYDSLGCDNRKLLRELEDIFTRRYRNELEDDEVEFIATDGDRSLRQTNDSDCGVYVCLVAEYVIHGNPLLTLRPEHMTYHRLRIAHSIYADKLQRPSVRSTPPTASDERGTRVCIDV